MAAELTAVSRVAILDDGSSALRSVESMTQLQSEHLASHHPQCLVFLATWLPLGGMYLECPKTAVRRGVYNDIWGWISQLKHDHDVNVRDDRDKDVEYCSTSWQADSPCWHWIVHMPEFGFTGLA